MDKAIINLAKIGQKMRALQMAYFGAIKKARNGGGTEAYNAAKELLNQSKIEEAKFDRLVEEILLNQ